MKREKLQTSANQKNFDCLSYFVVNEPPGSKRVKPKQTWKQKFNLKQQQQQ